MKGGDFGAQCQEIFGIFHCLNIVDKHPLVFVVKCNPELKSIHGVYVRFSTCDFVRQRRQGFPSANGALNG